MSYACEVVVIHSLTTSVPKPIRVCQISADFFPAHPAHTESVLTQPESLYSGTFLKIHAIALFCLRRIVDQAKRSAIAPELRAIAGFSGIP